MRQTLPYDGAAPQAGLLRGLSYGTAALGQTGAVCKWRFSDWGQRDRRGAPAQSAACLAPSLRKTALGCWSISGQLPWYRIGHPSPEGAKDLRIHTQLRRVSGVVRPLLKKRYRGDGT